MSRPSFALCLLLDLLLTLISTPVVLLRLQDWNVPDNADFLALLEQQIASTSQTNQLPPSSFQHLANYPQISPDASESSNLDRRDRSGSQESGMKMLQYRGGDDDDEDDYGSSGDEAQDHKRKKNGAAGTPSEGKKGKTGKGKGAVDGEATFVSSLAEKGIRKARVEPARAEQGFASVGSSFSVSDDDDGAKKSRRKSGGENKVSSRLFLRLLCSSPPGAGWTGTSWIGAASPPLLARTDLHSLFLAFQDDGKLNKRKEQNRAAQRAFRCVLAAVLKTRTSLRSLPSSLPPSFHPALAHLASSVFTLQGEEGEARQGCRSLLSHQSL